MSGTTPASVSVSAVHAPEFWTVVRTLSWQTFRRGWLNLLMVMLILCGVPTWLYASIRFLDDVTAHNLIEGGGTLKYLYFLITIVTLPTLVLFETMRVRPLYPLPVTTTRIVNVQLAIGTIGVIGLYLVTVVYYRLVFAAPVPVVGPLLFLVPGLVIAAGVASLLIDARWWKPLLAFVSLVLCIWWIARRFDEPILETAGAEWFSPTAVELLALSGLSVVGYFVALHTARLDRSGETQSWAVLEEYLYRFVGWVMRRLPSRLPSLHISSPTTPTSAQFSFEWLTKGLILPVMAAFAGTATLINAYFEPVEWFRAYTMAIPGILMFAMVLNGAFVGLMDGPGHKGQMDRFRATRPLSDWQLAAAALKNGLVSALVALVITMAMALLVYVYARLCGHTHSRIMMGAFTFRTGILNDGYAGGCATLILLGWGGMGINLSCIATGRHWIFPSLWMGGIGLFISAIVLEKQLAVEELAKLVQVVVTGVSLAAVAITTYCFQQATSRDLIPRWGIPAGVALGLAAAGLSYYTLVTEQMAAMGPLALPLVGLGALVALPLASTPLAIAWNRHR